LVYKGPGVNNRIGENLGSVGSYAVGEEGLSKSTGRILVELNADSIVRGRRDPRQNRLRGGKSDDLQLMFGTVCPKRWKHRSPVLYIGIPA